MLRTGKILRAITLFVVSYSTFTLCCMNNGGFALSKERAIQSFKHLSRQEQIAVGSVESYAQNLPFSHQAIQKFSINYVLFDCTCTVEKRLQVSDWLSKSLMARCDAAAYNFLTDKAFKTLSATEMSELSRANLVHNRGRIESILALVGERTYLLIIEAKCAQLKMHQKELFINAFVQSGLRTLATLSA